MCHKMKQLTRQQLNLRFDSNFRRQLRRLRYHRLVAGSHLRWLEVDELTEKISDLYTRYELRNRLLFRQLFKDFTSGR